LRFRRRRGWTLIWVSDHGRIHKTRPQAVGRLSAALGLLMVAAAAWGLWTTLEAVQAGRGLRRALEQVAAETAGIREEVDLLARRLASQRQMWAAREAEFRRLRSYRAKRVALRAVPGPVSPVGLPAMGGGGTMADAASDRTDDVPAEVSGLRWIPGAVDRPPQVKFRLESRLEERQKIQGFTFVILKPDPSDPASWSSLPPADLVDGRPRHCRRGDHFRITRFKRVTKTLPRPQADRPPGHISVLVYNQDGELWVEEALHPTRPEAMAYSAAVMDPSG
jgi:hypothetical protein